MRNIYLKVILNKFISYSTPKRISNQLLGKCFLFLKMEIVQRAMNKYYLTSKCYNLLYLIFLLASFCTQSIGCAL